MENISSQIASDFEAHLQCLSHSPLIGLNDPAAPVLSSVASALAKLKEGVERFAPDLVFLFAPDHFNGFFYECMPQFCVGMRATSVGDYGTGKDALQVPLDIARRCAQAALDDDIDVAVSFQMGVDHGFTQPLAMLTGSVSALPIVPIFINSAAPPLPTMRRARMLGASVGRFAATLRGKKVLFVGSGGLSHDPPVPSLDTAPPDVAKRLIERGNGDAGRAAREQRVVDVAVEFTKGTAAIHALSPEWDHDILRMLSEKDFSGLDAISNDAISEAAGKSANEVKSWVAAHAAMAAATGGQYEVRNVFYQAIPEWIAGFGALEGYQVKRA